MALFKPTTKVAGLLHIEGACTLNIYTQALNTRVQRAGAVSHWLAA